MREHEVPTHVQAEDRVLLGFTFPQIVAVLAVCAIAYGAYRYAPVGPSEVRMVIAVLFGLVGIAMAVGKVGGRRLPLVAADLLKYRLGARLYAGSVSQLVRAEPPAPPQPDRVGPGPLSLMAKKARRVFRNLRSKKRNRQKDRRNGRMPFRPHGWFGKRRKNGRHQQGAGRSAGMLESTRRRPLRGLAAVFAALLVTAVAVVPQVALAQSPEDERWRDEIDFEFTEPVEGRRIFVEGLSVSGDRAAVILRAATDLDIRVRAFGGPDGNSLRFWGSAALVEGERIDYSLPLNGPMPSVTVSWEDAIGQAGALTIKHDWIPYPLPEVEGEVCTVRLASLGWTPGAVSGVVESECAADLQEPVDIQTVTGFVEVTETALMDADVTQVTGTVLVDAGGTTASVALVPGGETAFRLPVDAGEAIRAVSVDVNLAAGLSIPMPPLTVLTHQPERTERFYDWVSVYRPGDTDTDTQTATAVCEDGTTVTATATAYAFVPSARRVMHLPFDILLEEHIKAEVVERSPITGSRKELIALASAVGGDDPFVALALPEPEPEEPPAEQEPAGGLQGWFEQLGWEWPW